MPEVWRLLCLWSYYASARNRIALIKYGRLPGGRGKGGLLELNGGPVPPGLDRGGDAWGGGDVKLYGAGATPFRVFT